MSEEKFKQAYNQLNLAQRQAVDEIEGPVMVSAGPGTGKTQILALRIANILRQTDTQPENILALTFTNAGVLSMRRRLADLIGTPAYRVVINTFHGFCNDLIGDFPDYFPSIIGALPANEIDQLKILEEIISRLPLKELKSSGDQFFYIKDINQRIEILKREGLWPEDLSNWAKQKKQEIENQSDFYHQTGRYAGRVKGKYLDELKQVRKNAELADIYTAYQRQLRADKLYDYNDMILEVKRAIEVDEELRLILQETYQYLLVDEHQDTNSSQNQVLEILASFYDQPNLFVVGDAKQAIYKFQGASLENFLYFKKRYPRAKFIALENNYRSGQLILDLAYSLLAGDKKLKATGQKQSEPVSVYEFSTEEIESRFIAQSIKEKIKAGVPAHEIAVFYRNNADASTLVEALDREGVPFVLKSSRNVLADPIIAKLILLLKAINHFGDEELFLKALHLGFLSVSPIDVYRLSVVASRPKTDLFKLVSNPQKLKNLGLLKADEVLAAYQLMADLSQKSYQQPLLKFFSLAVRESGFLTNLMSSSEPLANLKKLGLLFDEAKQVVEKDRQAKLADFIIYLDRLVDRQVAIKERPGESPTGAVCLSTAHGSKGLEYDYVYLAFVTDGRYGNRRVPNRIKLPVELFSKLSESDGDDNDDDRRLFYVALTRARLGIAITSARQRPDGREQLPSQFISELNPELIDFKTNDKWEKELKTDISLLTTSASNSALVLEKEFIKQIFNQRGLAVTHLNNYLKCPWRYFYSNLLRLPQAPSESQMHGLAAHGALEDFFRLYREADPGREFLLLKYTDYLNRQPIDKKQLAEVLNRGREELGGYYDFWQGRWPRRVITEKKIKGVVFDDKWHLVGKLDKVEILNDQGGVNVVDYKTSKPKTRGEIEGKTKNSTGDIKRQLVFYKLLLDNWDSGKLKMQSAEIDFLKADKQGRYRREKFEITNDELSALKEIIRQMIDEVVNLKFWDKTCGEVDCPFCKLRSMMDH